MTDPLHGITLETLLQTLVDRHGWEALARRVPIRCFEVDPTLSSSLKFLRKTPWARAKVEALYVRDQRKTERNRKRSERRATRRAAGGGMPLERPETLAFVWPADTPAPDAQVAPDVTLTRGVDRPAFCAVQQAIGFTVTDDTWNTLTLVPDAMVVAHVDGSPVAVACAEQRADGWVELGWVAVAPEQRGRGLGRAVSTAVVAHLLQVGHPRIFGSTQDDRIAALTIYLGMGFQPVPRPEKAERWAAVHARMP